MFKCLLWLALIGAVAASSYLNFGMDELYNSREDGVRGGPKVTNCTCGKSNKDRVVGGRSALKNEFPLMAALVTLEGERIVFCGATIITHYHAITATHCLVPHTGNKIGLLIGMHDITKAKDDTVQLIPIKHRIEHEEYDMGTMENDIAMIVTAAKMEFSKVVGPACLPTKNRNYEGEFVKVIGWGRLKEMGAQASVLQKVNMKVVPLADCKKYSPHIILERKTQICATLPKRDSCDGDSGGPLLWVDPDTNSFTLIGLVSDGTICGERPGIYTNIGSYLGWIQAKIAATHPGSRTCSKVG